MPRTKEILDITVLGATTTAHQMAVSTINQYLRDAHIPFTLREETDVSVFIEEGVESIPAIKVGNQLLPLRQNGSFNRSLRDAVNTILRRYNYGSIPKIVIPVDFSDTSINAFMYGHRLASDLGAVTKALHVYFPTSRELSQSTVLDVDFAAVREGYLDEFISKVDLDWGSDLLKASLIDKDFRTGFPGEEILDSIEDNGAAYVIMGSTGDSNRIKKWFGSVSTKVMNDAEVPVLLVPEQASYKGVHKVMYAFDDIAIDRAVIDQLVAFVKPHNAHIHLVHMSESGNPDPGYYLKEILDKHYKADKVILKSLYDSDVVLALSDYARDESIDVIAMATQHRSFINQIFHDSITKRMSLHTGVPLLILK